MLLLLLQFLWGILRLLIFESLLESGCSLSESINLYFDQNVLSSFNKLEWINNLDDKVMSYLG
jgi:hypothetical protein